MYVRDNTLIRGDHRILHYSPRDPSPTSLLGIACPSRQLQFRSPFFFGHERSEYRRYASSPRALANDFGAGEGSFSPFFIDRHDNATRTRVLKPEPSSRVLYYVLGDRVINGMNVLLTAVDCASSALMLGAAGFDEEETSTFNDIAFVLQLMALVGEILTTTVLQTMFP